MYYFFFPDRTGATLLMCIGKCLSIICPFCPSRLGFLCFLRIPTPSTNTISSLGNTCKTFPVLPFSLPVSTYTASPFLTCCFIWILNADQQGLTLLELLSHYFRSFRNNRPVSKHLELARDRTKDAARLWLLGAFSSTLNYNYCVIVKTEVRPVFAAERVPLAHHHCAQNIFFLHLLARLCCLHRKNHQLAYLSIALVGTPKHLENASDLCAGVVCNGN